MSENNFYKIIKTTPYQVLFKLHSISNPSLVKTVNLTNRIPEQVVPMDWALDVFLNEETFELFKKGLITFNDVDGILADAITHGVYFGDGLDFTPATKDDNKLILKEIESGNRARILDAIKTYGDDRVRSVVIANVANLKSGVVQMLENIFKVQLIADGE